MSIEDDLLRWIDDKYDDDDDPGDELHRHFESLPDLTHWIEIAREGTRLLSILLDTKFEDDSMVDNILKACCAHAFRGASVTLANALQLNGDGLNEVVEEIEFESIPTPITYEELVESINGMVSFEASYPGDDKSSA